MQNVITMCVEVLIRAPVFNPSREATLNLRIDAALKIEFAEAVKAEDRPAAEVLRALMRGYVEDAPAAPLCRRGAQPVSTHRFLRG